MDEAKHQYKQVFGDVDSKNPVDGFAKGIFSVTKGVYVGLHDLVYHPIRGARQEGGIGFAKGAARGMAAAVFYPVAGVVHGGFQIGMGFKNTQETVRAFMNNNEREDSAAKKGEVVLSDSLAITEAQGLYAEARRRVMLAATSQNYRASLASGLAAIGAESSSVNEKKSSSPSAKASQGDGQEAEEVVTVKEFVKETELYDVLGVAPDASSEKIKKNYFKLARDYHPDKHPDDELAKEKFQAVSEAYQVLMDPERRAKYNHHGRASLEDSFMDPGSFFTMTFGADKFKDLVGVLTVAFTAAGDVTEEMLHQFQELRENNLAAILRQRLQPWVNGKEATFLEQAVAEVSELLVLPFGEAFLHCIGYTYFHHAEMLLGLHHTATGIPGFMLALKQHRHMFVSRYRAVGAAQKIFQFKKMAELNRDIGEVQGALPEFLDSVWLVSVLDIESTLRRVVEVVVMDKAVAKDTQKARARGIMKLGRVFMEASHQELPSQQPPEPILS